MILTQTNVYIHKNKRTELALVMIKIELERKIMHVFLKKIFHVPL